MFKITIAKPRLGIDLLLNTALFICQFLGKLNTALFICQLFGKLQPFLIVFNSQFKQFACFVRILGFLGMFKITMAKPRSGVDLLLNTVLFICQFLGKLQPFLIVFNSQFKQFACFVRIFCLHGLFEITMAKPRLNPALFCNLSTFICNRIPSLM